MAQNLRQESHVRLDAANAKLTQSAHGSRRGLDQITTPCRKFGEK